MRARGVAPLAAPSGAGARRGLDRRLALGHYRGRGIPTSPSSWSARSPDRRSAHGVGAALYPTRVALYHHAPDLVRAQPGAARPSPRSRSPGGAAGDAGYYVTISTLLQPELSAALFGVKAPAPGGGCAAARRVRTCATCARRASLTPRHRADRAWACSISRRRDRARRPHDLPRALGFWLSLRSACRSSARGGGALRRPRHYRFLFTDPRFWSAAHVTLIFAVASVFLEVILGVGVALLLWTQQLGRRLALGLLLLAWALPAVVTAKVFEWLYHPAAGLVNFLLGGRQINWLGDPALALPALISPTCGGPCPSSPALLRAAPRHSGELYEAAEVDGPGAAAIFRLITLPMLRRILMIAALSARSTRCGPVRHHVRPDPWRPPGTTEMLTVYAYRSRCRRCSSFRLGRGRGRLRAGDARGLGYLRAQRGAEAVA